MLRCNCVTWPFECIHPHIVFRPAIIYNCGPSPTKRIIGRTLISYLNNKYHAYAQWSQPFFIKISSTLISKHFTEQITPRLRLLKSLAQRHNILQVSTIWSYLIKRFGKSLGNGKNSTNSSTYFLDHTNIKHIQKRHQIPKFFFPSSFKVGIIIIVMNLNTKRHSVCLSSHLGADFQWNVIKPPDSSETPSIPAAWHQSLRSFLLGNVFCSNFRKSKRKCN